MRNGNQTFTFAIPQGKSFYSKAQTRIAPGAERPSMRPQGDGLTRGLLRTGRRPGG